jgi:hypothetical protein
MLLFLIFALISEVHDKGTETEYKYTISVNPLSFVIEGAGHGGVLIVPTPGINFELRALGRLSLNFELNNLFFIIPVEFEVGIREYLLKEFEGVYIYQGVAAAKAVPFLVIPALGLYLGYSW